MTTTQAAEGERLVYSGEICAEFGIGDRALRKWVSGGRFPPPDANLNGRNVWLERTVRAFKAAVLAGSHSQPRRPSSAPAAAV